MKTGVDQGFAFESVPAPRPPGASVERMPGRAKERIMDASLTTAVFDRARLERSGGISGSSL